MTGCPDDRQLSLLLEEQLGPDELTAVEAHLEGCDRCQGTLDGLTRDQDSVPDWRPWVDPAGGDDAGSRSSFDGLGADFGREQRRRAKLSGSFPSVRSPTLAPRGAGAGDGPGGGGPSEPEGMPTVEGYEILGRLGQGGMGVVYRARQRGLDRLVALKMIRAGSHAGPEHLLRFQIEVRAVARLRHPNVVQVYDVGEADGLPYVALELLEGGSLQSKVDGTPQPEAKSAEMVEILARAIASAHRAGVVHRDLKPANVLFSADGTPKVADFGLAKRLDEEDGQTHSGQVMGSPSFMAPEQARGLGRAVGPSADIYSLGAILYELLAGRPPFKGGSAMETLFQVVNDEPVPPSRLRPGLSRDLETICLKCLSKEPHRRYPDADALADDLARHQHGAPILGRRTGPAERLAKWARRQPAAAALVASALVLAVGLAVALERAGEANRRHDAWLAGRRAEGIAAGRAAGDALDRGHWEEGRKALGPWLEAIGSDPDPGLDDLRARARALLAGLARGKDEADRAASALARLGEFDRLRREAQIRDARGATIGQAGESGTARSAAFEALAAFDEPGSRVGVDPARPGGWRPAPIPASLPPEGRDAVARGRVELLLIWAEAIALAGPGEDPRAQAVAAIGVLGQVPGSGGPERARRSALARYRLASGDLEAAARERAEAEATPPADALDHLALGLERQRARRPSAAIAEFEQALRLDPGQFRAQLWLAICQLQVGRPALARANLAACLQRAPRAPYLYRLRGFACGEEGAEKQKVAREAGPRLAALAAEGEGQFADAEADFRTAIELSGDDEEGRYAVLVNRGVLRIRARRLDDAVGDLREAVRLRPRQFAAYVGLGQAFGKQGRADDSVAQFTLAIALRPDLASLFRSRALARLDRPGPPPAAEARDRSLADLETAIRLEPAGSIEAAADRARRARLLHLAARHAEALAEADAALRANPGDPEALLFRVKSLLELKRFDEVVGAADAALTRGTPTAELFDLRGQARAARDDFARAIDDYGRGLALEPGRPSLLVHRGWAYAAFDAPKPALHDFDEAIRVAPDLPEAYAGRGFALALHGLHRQAVADAEESLRRGGLPDARTTYNAARIYARASATVAEGPRRAGGTAQLADDYQDRAQGLIRLAIDRLPPDRRDPFWREVVQGDPALASIRQRPKFAQLAGQFARPAR